MAGILPSIRHSMASLQLKKRIESEKGKVCDSKYLTLGSYELLLMRQEPFCHINRSGKYGPILVGKSEC